MAVSAVQFQALRTEVDDLNLVVHGNEAKDVVGLRKRVTTVEELTEQLAEANKLDRERRAWIARGIAIGLAVNIVGNLPGIIQFVTTYLLPLLGGHP